MSPPRFYATLDHLAEVHLRGRANVLQQRQDYEDLAQDLYVRGRVDPSRSAFYQQLVADGAGAIDRDYSANDERNRDYLCAALLVRDVRRQPCPDCGPGLEHRPGCLLPALLAEWDAVVAHVDARPPAAPVPVPQTQQLSLF